jgi:acetyl/propionyl-CoA carboxylase alpha subunit
VETNLAFFREILSDAEFREGRLNTRFIADYFSRREPVAEPGQELELVAALAAAAHSENEKPETRNEKPETSAWLSEGRSGLLR